MKETEAPIAVVFYLNHSLKYVFKMESAVFSRKPLSSRNDGRWSNSPLLLLVLRCSLIRQKRDYPYTRTRKEQSTTRKSRSTDLPPGVCLFVGSLTSQQQASVFQGRICSDKFTYYHTEIEVADQTFYFTQSQYTDTGPTSPSADPITPSAWQGSHWSANF